MQVVHTYDSTYEGRPGGVTGLLGGLLDGKSPLSKMLYGYLGDLYAQRYLREAAKIKDFNTQSEYADSIKQRAGSLQNIADYAAAHNNQVSAADWANLQAGLGNDEKARLWRYAKTDADGNVTIDPAALSGDIGQLNSYYDNSWGANGPDRSTINTRQLNGSGDNRYRTMGDIRKFQYGAAPTGDQMTLAGQPVGTQVQQNSTPATDTTSLTPKPVSLNIGPQANSESTSLKAPNTNFSMNPTSNSTSLMKFANPSVGISMTNPDNLNSLAQFDVSKSNMFNSAGSTPQETANFFKGDTGTTAAKSGGGMDMGGIGMGFLQGGLKGAAQSALSQAATASLGPVGGIAASLLMGGGNDDAQFQQMAQQGQQQVEQAADQSNNKDRSGEQIDTSEYSQQAMNNPTLSQFQHAASNVGKADDNYFPSTAAQGSTTLGQNIPRFNDGNDPGTYGFGGGSRPLFASSFSNPSITADNRTTPMQNYRSPTQYPYHSNADHMFNSMWGRDW